MGASNSKWSIRSLSPCDADFLPALHLAVTACPQNSKTIAPSVHALLKSETLSGLRLRPVVAAYIHNELHTAVVGVESPGAANLFLLPFELAGPSDLEGGLLALQHALALTGEYGISLSQVIGPTQQSKWDRALLETGFTRLTELVYLTRSGGINASCLLESHRGSDLRWVAYSPEMHSFYCGALEQSYVQSMDCPELTGVRTVQQSLASHRSAGEFDPATWFVLADGNRPLGVLLLNKVRGEPVTEIVYMGVSQLARGNGVGDMLMEQAIRVTSANATNLILAVDERNAPARRLYRRWGFTEIGRRAAWIANMASIGP